MLNSVTHTNIDHTIDILRIIQICDSNFPVGSFNHSFGMETYLRNNTITDTKSMREWVKVFLNDVFIYNDGLGIKLLYEYLEKNEKDKIYELDRLLTVQSVAKESREGSKLIARRMLKLFLDLYKCEALKEYEEEIKKKKVFGHPAIVFGIMMHNLNFKCEEALCFHMYSTIGTIIQNAVRAIPLGQKDGQLLLKESYEKFNMLCNKIEKLDESYLGGCTPGIELSQINHENLEFRLFMS